MRKLVFPCLALLALLPGLAKADPSLQLYVEGATYDTGSSTWTISGASVTLWVVAQGGASDVRIYVASPTTSGLTETVTPTRIGGGSGSYTFPGGSTPFQDSGLAASPTLGTTGVGTTPPGLSPHGVYGSGTSWQEFKLGNFSSPPGTTVNIADFSGTSPINPDSDTGIIYGYTVAFNGVPGVGVPVNIDATSGGGSDFAPYSHSARGTGTPDAPPAAPEPSTIALALTGLIPLGVVWRRRSRRRSTTGEA
jgi:hypothetical protein